MKLTLRIIRDEHPLNPREEYDHLGTMVCWHSRYDMGDKHEFSNPIEFNHWSAGKRPIMLPIYMYDHSGITINTTGFDCPWDSGQIGWIYVTMDDVRKEWHGEPITDEIIAKVADILRCEVREYDQYLTGDVWGYVIEDEDGNHVDSCCGFYGHDYCQTEGENQLQWWERWFANQEKEAAMAETWP